MDIVLSKAPDAKEEPTSMTNVLAVSTFTFMTFITGTITSSPTAETAVTIRHATTIRPIFP